jgi:hypothetical protein
MRASAAFALGLFSGAVAVTVAGLFHWDEVDGSRTFVPPEVTVELANRSLEIDRLRQDQTRLLAESERLKETVAELKSNVAPYIMQRRVPFRELQVPGTQSSPPDTWMAQAVASGDVSALPRLEDLATQNVGEAIDALALMAEHDNGAALTRAWASGMLTTANKIRATRLLAATFEVNPQVDQLLGSLFADVNTDSLLLYAALEGIGNPAFNSEFAQLNSIPPPPHFEPNYAARMQFLDKLAVTVTSENVEFQLDAARAALQDQQPQAGQTPQ